MKRSPLFESYRHYRGVKLVDFHGWELPLNFEAGIIGEHVCVRKNAGLFDVSHMGEVSIEGPGAQELVDWLVTNDVRSLPVGRALYSPMCYPDGGVVDDLLVYRRGDERFMLVVNASNTEKDLRWIREQASAGGPAGVRGGAGIRIEDRSDAVALMALQGPKAADYLGEVTDTSALRPFAFLDELELFGHRVLLSRTGYTGEDGFELFSAAEEAPAIWGELMRLYGPRGVLPCGLGARDTLRIEARLPLYGQELSADISPLEAGLSPFVKLEKADFCGRAALLEQKERGVPRVVRGFRMIDKGVPRTGYPVFIGEKPVGSVTSGMKSPTLDAFIGLVLAERGTVKRGTQIEIEAGTRRKRAEIVATPFYRRARGKK